jgi:hypothetical protein
LVQEQLDLVDCKNYASHDAKRFLVARAIEDRAELEVCRRIIPAANTIVCRLTANIETMQQRVKMRELDGRSGNTSRELLNSMASWTALDWRILPSAARIARRPTLRGKPSAELAGFHIEAVRV